MQIGFKKIHPDAKLPTYAHEGDAGMDVYAVENAILYPGKACKIPTGLIAEIPMGYEIQVRPRSGLALNRNITVLNAPGTVDAGYRNEIGIILMYSPDVDSFRIEDGKITADCEHIRKGDRIAQFVVAPVTKCEPIEVTEVSDTERGMGGFGSTGIK